MKDKPIYNGWQMHYTTKKVNSRSFTILMSWIADLILEPADILAGLSLGRKFAQGKGKSVTNESVFMYWNKEGDPVGMKILDPNSTRMLNIGQTELPDCEGPRTISDMFHEFNHKGNEKQLNKCMHGRHGHGDFTHGDQKKPLEWKDEKSESVSFKT